MMEAAKMQDLQIFKSKLLLILSDYKIEKKETAIVPYSVQKNDMLLKRFMVAKAVSGRTEKTIRAYKDVIRRFLLDVEKDADAITSTDIQLYIAKKMTEGASKSYCDTIRRYMASFFGYLYREEIIQRNPMVKVEPIKFHKENENAFSDMEIELMRNACRTAFERAAIEVLLSTGCRASELCTIKTTDIMGDGSISILGKGEKRRTVYLNAKAIVAVKNYLKERNDNNPYLFPGGIFGAKKKKVARCLWYQSQDIVSPDNHYSAGTLNMLVKNIAKRAGVEDAHAHRFRRTCATLALRHGMPIEMVSMMLGHEQLSTTQIYLDIRESDLKIAHEKYVL